MNIIRQTLTLCLLLLFCGCAPNHPPSKIPVPHIKSDGSIETVHFFLENSGSMFGYFEPTSIEGPEAFIDLGNILSRLQYEVDSVKTYLISEKVHPIGDNAKGFTDYFRPWKMKIKGQGLSSDITKMFSECIQQTSDNSISILVSDGIYSIDKKNIIDELKRSSQKTKHELIGRLRERDFAIAAIKFNGVFNGVYYCPKKGEERINQRRPYYIWIFGDLSQIEKIIKASVMEGEKGYENSAFFFKNDQIKYSSKVLDSGSSKIGAFKSGEENSVLIIKNAEKAERGTNEGEFQFGLAVDYSELPLSSDFIENIDNYTITPDDYEVVGVIPRQEFDDNTSNTIKITVKDWTPTHILEIRNKSKLLGDFKLSLDQNLPSWILLSSSNGDEDIIGNTTKTFGFKYLMVDGIFQAFDEVNKHKPYCNIKFKVEP